MTAAPAPCIPTPDLAEQIPAELREIPHWVLWRWEQRGGKWTKPPFCARGGPASSTDPATWAAWDVALAGAHAQHAAGVGIVLSGDGLIGIDLDHCVNPEDGMIADWAADVIDAIGSYAEVSPSGEGIRIFVRGVLPPEGRKRGNVEMYDRERYLTVTGRRIPGTPAAISRTAQAAIDAFHARTFPARPAPSDRPANVTPILREDNDLVAAAYNARNGQRFGALLSGDLSAYNGDESAADMAFASLLAFWTRDPDQIDRIVRRSGLYRDKWDSRRGNTTYGRMTIDRALALVTTHYEDRTPATRRVEGSMDPLDPPPAVATPTAPAAATLTWLTAREIAEQTPEAVDWVVEGYIARGAITDWSAKVKTGKTSLMLVCARSVVNGEAFLGLPTAKGPVVILTEERPPSFRSALGRWGLLESDDVHVLYRREARGMEWPDIITAAVEKCLAVGAVLLVIDTFADWAQFGADQENDAGAAAEAMLPVQYAAEQGVAVLMSRHDRKSGGEIGESARGSSAIAGKADILVSIRRADGAGHERRRVIVAVGRFDDTPEQLVVELNAQDQYVALGDSLDVERHEARARVLDILPSSAPGLSFDELLSQSAGHARSTLLRAVKDLVDERQIFTAKGAGPSKRAAGYWRPLGPETDETGQNLGQTPHNGEHSTPSARGMLGQFPIPGLQPETPQNTPNPGNPFSASETVGSENIPTPRTRGMFDIPPLDREWGPDVNVRSSPTNIPTSDPYMEYRWNVPEPGAGTACLECADSPVTYDPDGRPLCREHAPNDGSWWDD